MPLIARRKERNSIHAGIFSAYFVPLLLPSELFCQSRGGEARQGALVAAATDDACVRQQQQQQRYPGIPPPLLPSA